MSSAKKAELINPTYFLKSYEKYANKYNNIPPPPLMQ
jgi:hypothetical protein